MKSFRIALSGVLVLAISLILIDVAPAAAVTCESTCNQLRRACRYVAKANTQVAYAACDTSRDSCRTACEANAEQCPVDCQTAHAACTGGGGTGCDEALALCLDVCANCETQCNADRVTCRDAAKAAREAANVACTMSGESCDSVCVDPIDPVCVSGCKTDSRDCESDARSAEKMCRQGCDRGAGLRACGRDCRAGKNAAFAVCGSAEVLCVGGCAGVVP